MRSSLLGIGMAGLGLTLLAQTAPPLPAVGISWHPPLGVNVWPADFNRDGRTDLIAGTDAPGGVREPVDLVVSLGRGDGTFLAPTSLGLAASPLTVSDMNRDGFIDVLLLRDDWLEILPGNGDGTFDAPVPVAQSIQYADIRAWGHVNDFDGDGHRDIVAPMDTQDSIQIHFGNGDFMFDAPIALQASAPRGDITSGDFNKDGRPDFAVAEYCCVTVYLNNGGRSFTPAHLPTDMNAPHTDITTRDLNADAKLDLIVTSGSFDFHYTYTDPGSVAVYLGNGNGTFQAPAFYPTGVKGTMSVAVGDFTGDGKLDVATGNRSGLDVDDVGSLFWDTISILPGDGTGRLLPATSFSLSDVHGAFGEIDPRYPFQYAQHQLNTSDLNGDGRTDLISSPGVIALTRAPAANHAPAVFAGPDDTEFNFEQTVDLRAEGTDPDRHWLTYVWRNQSGTIIGTLPWIKATQTAGTWHTYTVTATDPAGATATDSVRIRARNYQGDPYINFIQPSGGNQIVRGVPYMITWGNFDPGDVLQSFSVSYSIDNGRTFAPIPGCQDLPIDVPQCLWTNPGPLTATARLQLLAKGDGDFIRSSETFSIVASPAEWSSTDIGTVGAAGTTAFANGTWTIEGSGADIWDTADELRYVSRQVTGNFTITTRVASIENLNRWVKAGLMLREDLSAGSRHVSLLATPRTERGLAFQGRLQANGYSVHTAGPAVAPPGWLRIGRVGDTISAYYRAAPSAPWTFVGRQTLTGLPQTIYAGLAVSSHVDGTLASAVFDNVAVDPHLINSSQDVGNVGVAGSMAFDGVLYQLRGSGTDIWGTADAFRFAHQLDWQVASTLEITARVRSITNTHPWAKAGVMFRESSVHVPQVGHVMVVVTPGHGVAMQYRPGYGEPSVQVAVRAGTAPEWVRLAVSGNVYTGYASEDGVTWQTIGSVATTEGFRQPGLAVTSHDNSTLTTAIFEDVQLLPYLSR
jgi:hypothetical protein